jgi:hypothetical protein
MDFLADYTAVFTDGEDFLIIHAKYAAHLP